MQEFKDTPAIRIVDYGEVPINKYKPKRAIMVIIASISALFLTLLAVYFFDFLDRTRGTDESQWLDEIINILRKDLLRLKRFLRIGTKT